jgi:site-specific DNA-methyltransferase (adenine-specific)
MKHEQIGDITLWNGDCLDIIKTIPDSSIDLIITDPPYLIPAINGGGSVNKNRGFNKILETSLKETQDITLGYDIDSFANEVERLQGGNINAYFWCNKLQIPQYFKTYVERLGCKFDILCFHKNNPMPTYSNKYLADTEYCLFFHKGKGRTFPQTYNDAFTYWVEPLNQKDKTKYVHPTIKPLNMIDRLVRNSSKEGDMILDCFLGSGTTAVASLMNKRKCIGIEINPTYYEIAKNRINEYNNQQTLF